MNAAELKQRATQWLAQGHAAVLVELRGVKGSAPRDAGTRMVVTPEACWGTIGGGQLEWKAQATARQLLSGMATWPAPQRLALGPSLGQCCGGSVELVYAPLNPASLDAWALPTPRFHLCLYGAGHVGQSLVRVLRGVEASVDWMDTREEAFASLPSEGAAGLRWWVSEDLAAEATQAPSGAHHLVMTHSHSLDFDIVLRLLSRQDTGLVGLIGSKTKRRLFEGRLMERGLTADRVADLVCPVGDPRIQGKEPAVVAVSVAAQLLSLPASP